MLNRKSNNKHLMTGPSGNSQSLSVLLYLPNQNLSLGSYEVLLPLGRHEVLTHDSLSSNQKTYLSWEV